ncbi:hypothetical protein [Thiolapillus sp.]
MTDRPPNPLKVSFKGIEGLSRKSLAFLFSTQKTMEYEIVEEHLDAIQIIDIDHHLGKTAWENLQASSREQQSRIPVIILGSEATEVENGISLQKPFLPRELLATVESLAVEISNKTDPHEAATTKLSLPDITFSTSEPETLIHISTAPDVNLDDPNAIAAAQYDPGQFLAQRMLELIELAAREKKYIHAGCCGVMFYVDPHLRCIRTLVKERNLRTFGALPLDYDSFVYHKEARLPAKIESQGFRFTYEDFIWRMILAGSRGRLPENTDLDQRFLLRNWPNLTELPQFPHLMQISASWAAAPKSIRQMARELDIPQRYIFAFFAAASMMDYLHPADASSSQAARASAPETKPENRGLFQRWLKSR